MSGADADPPTGADGSTAAAADPGPPEHDPFVRRVAVVLALTTATVALAALAVIGSSVLLAAFGGVLLAIILAACAHALERRSPLSYSWALATVFALSLAVVAVAGWLLGAQLAVQVDESRGCCRGSSPTSSRTSGATAGGRGLRLLARSDAKIRRRGRGGRPGHGRQPMHALHLSGRVCA